MQGQVGLLESGAGQGQTLNYSNSRPSRWKIIRRFALAILVGATAWFVAARSIRFIRSNARRQTLQNQCMLYALPQNAIVIECDSARARTLPSHYYANQMPIAASEFSIDGQATFDLKVLLAAQQDCHAALFGGEGGVVCFRATRYSSGENVDVFLHQRFTPKGESRLVAINVQLKFGVRKTADLTPTVLIPGNIFRNARVVTQTTNIQIPHIEDGSNSFRLFAGQPDPNDPSRLTVDYETTDGRGTIEGLLDENDQVTLRIINGPLSRGMSQ
jgi:hypothetical protein